MTRDSFYASPKAIRDSLARFARMLVSDQEKVETLVNATIHLAYSDPENAAFSKADVLRMMRGIFIAAYCDEVPKCYTMLDTTNLLRIEQAQTIMGFLPPHQQYLLSLHAQGFLPEEISSLTGEDIESICEVLRQACRRF